MRFRGWLGDRLAGAVRVWWVVMGLVSLPGWWLRRRR